MARTFRDGALAGTLRGDLSREVEESLPKVREFFREDEPEIERRRLQ